MVRPHSFLASVLIFVLHGVAAESGTPAAAPEKQPVIVLNQGHAVRALAFSPDGKALMSASIPDPTVPVWEVASGKEIGRFAWHGGGVFSLAFAPDGKTVAIGTGEGAVVVRSFPSGEEQLQLKAHTQAVCSVAFSEDQKLLLSGGRDRKAFLWRMGRDKPLGTFARRAPVEAAVFLSAGQHVILGGDPPSRYEIGREANLPSDGATLTRGPAGSFALSPDGKTLAVLGGYRLSRFGREELTSHGLLVLIDPDSGIENAALKTDRRRIFCAAAFSHDGRLLATGGSDGVVSVWELASGQEVLRLADHVIPVRAVAFAPDGRRLASGGDDAVVRLWNLPLVLADAAPKNALSYASPWNELLHRDAATAFRAQWRLLAAGDDCVSFLEKSLRSMPVPRAKIEALIADLDDRRYGIRARAMAELRALGSDVVPSLELAATKRISEEVRRRAWLLVQELKVNGHTREQLREKRAVAVLEWLGSSRSRAALRDLATTRTSSATAAWEAQQSLQRLAKRPAE